MSQSPLEEGVPNKENAKPRSRDVNFFKPQTPHATADMRMIVALVLVWAVAVFGFQFLLIAFNQPTPEPGYTSFQAIWPKAQDGSASVEERRELARITLSVLGKNIALQPDHKATLQEALTITAMALIPEAERASFSADLGDDAKRAATASQAVSAIGLQDSGFDKLRADLVPSSLIAVSGAALPAGLPDIMELYLVHNQSFLTDFIFIGFPFHYWYTAQFLLILFVVLCLIYASVTDSLNEKYDFQDE